MSFLQPSEEGEQLHLCWHFSCPRVILISSVLASAKLPINPLIYGVNFPTSADYIKKLGVTISRWGGNAVTAYNPFGGFTNAGADWYFENRAIDNGQADDWMSWVQGAGSSSLLTIPA